MYSVLPLENSAPISYNSYSLHDKIEKKRNEIPPISDSVPESSNILITDSKISERMIYMSHDRLVHRYPLVDSAMSTIRNFTFFLPIYDLGRTIHAKTCDIKPDKTTEKCFTNISKADSFFRNVYKISPTAKKDLIDVYVHKDEYKNNACWDSVNQRLIFGKSGLFEI